MKSPKEMARGRGLSLSSSAEMMTRMLLPPEVLGSLSQVIKPRGMQEKIDRRRQAERRTPTKSRQPVGRIPGVSRILAGEGFPNRLSSRLQSDIDPAVGVWPLSLKLISSVSM